MYGNKCLDVSGAGTADGTAVLDLGLQRPELNQKWRLNSDGTMTAVGANKCLEVNGTANGTKARIWTCNGGTNQKWARA